VTALVGAGAAAGRFDMKYLELRRKLVATMRPPALFPGARRRGADAVVRHRLQHREHGSRSGLAGNERVVRPHRTPTSSGPSIASGSKIVATRRQVLFQNQLGSLYDKSQRVRALAVEIA
jgi:hypothetical protein